MSLSLHPGLSKILNFKSRPRALLETYSTVEWTLVERTLDDLTIGQSRRFARRDLAMDETVEETCLADTRIAEDHQFQAEISCSKNVVQGTYLIS